MKLELAREKDKKKNTHTHNSIKLSMTAAHRRSVLTRTRNPTKDVQNTGSNNNINHIEEDAKPLAADIEAENTTDTKTKRMRIPPKPTVCNQRTSNSILNGEQGKVKNTEDLIRT